MPSPIHHAFRLALLVAGTAANLHAGSIPSSDPDLPESFNGESLAPLLVGQSPFNRVVDFAQTYQLTGIAYIDGKPVATLLNKETKQRFVVTEEANAQGWRLAEATQTPDIAAAGVKVIIGGEEVDFHYNDSQMAPDEKASRSSSSRKHKVIKPVDIHNLAESEMIRKDENGKPYVRGSVYLSEKDRDFYYNGMSRDAHSKFNEIIRDSREKMFAYSPEKRAAYAKKVFDKVVASEKKR